MTGENLILFDIAFQNRVKEYMKKIKQVEQEQKGACCDTVVILTPFHSSSITLDTLSS
jgi:hypothetical protein